MSLSPPASVSPQGVSWGKPEEAGPGWEQDRPLRRAKTSRARRSGAQGSSPGAGVVAPAAGGLAAAASAPAAARRRGRSRAGVSPSSGCSGGAGGGARAEPEPSRCPSPARYRGRCWAGRPCHCSRRLRVRAGGASSAGKGEAPAPLQSFGEVLSPHIQACASGSCPSVSSAPPSTLCSRVTRAAPRVLTPGARGLAAGLLGTCNG